jgi:hypothetical protein
LLTKLGSHRPFCKPLLDAKGGQPTQMKQGHNSFFLVFIAFVEEATWYNVQGHLEGILVKVLPSRVGGEVARVAIL